MKQIKQIKKINFTKEGLEDLKKELISLEESRPDAVKELSRAREMGDLSENGLYTAAKARLRSMDARMNRIKYMIKFSNVHVAQKDVIGIGSTVKVEQNGTEITYEIVGDFEANPHDKKISAKSPLGYALVGKRVGDSTQFETPSGKQIIKINKLL